MKTQSGWPKDVELYAAMREPLVGRVWSGTQTSFWYDRVPKIRRAAAAMLGSEPIPGSLNLWFVREVRFAGRIVRTGSQRWPTAVFCRCLMTRDGKKFLRGVAIRPRARMSVAWLEIMADTRLRKALDIKDNSVLHVWLLP